LRGRAAPQLFTFVATEEAHGFKETGDDGQAGP
jgi:hypothetical protein